MKAIRKPSSITLPIWMDVAVRDLARRHKRTLAGEIEFLIEEAIKNTPIIAQYCQDLVLEGTTTHQPGDDKPAA